MLKQTVLVTTFQHRCASVTFTQFTRGWSSEYDNCLAGTVNMPKEKRERYETTLRFTPHKKQPHSRCITGSAKGGRCTERNAHPGVPVDFNDVVNVSWRVYDASPLYKFSQDSKHFKKYSLELEQRLRPTLQELNKQTVQHRVCMTRLEGLKMLRRDPDAVKLTIHEVNKRTKESRLVLHCILCIVRDDRDLIRKRLPVTYTRLPLVVISGPESLAEKVVVYFEERFDCRITKVSFPPLELKWMCAMWAGAVDNPTKKVQLVYSLPDEVKGIRKITYDINPQDCQDLWRSIHDLEEPSFTEAEVVAFMTALQHHFYRHFKVNLTRCQLVEIKSSVVAVAAEGKLKLFDEESVLRVFRHLTTILVEDQDLG